VPISSVVVKTDTSATAKPVVVNSKDNQNNNQKAPKSDKKFECVFVKEGDKAKLRVIKTGIQDDTNIEVSSGLKKRRCCNYRSLYYSYERFEYGRFGTYKTG